MKISAFVLGFIFAFLLKRGRFCFAGTIEDVVLEKHPYNLVLFLALVSIEATLYHLMIMMGVVMPVAFKYFSLLATSIGGTLFGIGAVLCSGCITATLIKVGDGRITGIISAIFFMIGTLVARNGILKAVSQFLFSKTLLKDELYKTSTPLVLLIFGMLMLISYVLMFVHCKKEKLFSLPPKYSHFLLHLCCEKLIRREIVVVLTAVLLALGFYFSNLTGRNDSFAITAPLSSIFNILINGQGAVDWAVILVIGIVSGSFFTAFISGEFSVVSTSASSIIKHIIGGILMGVGATWAGGCIVSNGLVATAQLSIRAWVAFAFMMLGIWMASSILNALLMRKYRR